MRIGYARFSTQEQDTQTPIVALGVAGSQLLFQENQAAVGTALNYIGCCHSCVKAM